MGQASWRPGMGQAYTPGLKVRDRMVVVKERRLPLKGEVLVAAGDAVKAETVVAKTDLPGQVELVNIANALGVDAREIKQCMIKREGERVEKGEILAHSSGMFGLFK